MADGHTFNYLADDGYVYLVVADEAYGRQIPFACLERVKDEFKSQYGDRARDAIAHALDRSFGPRIKAQMEYCANNPDELSKVSRVQAQVSEVKNIMMDNIEKVLDRGEKIELLVDKTENPRFQADNFHRTGRQLRQRMWWNKLKMQLMFARARSRCSSWCYSSSSATRAATTAPRRRSKSRSSRAAEPVFGGGGTNNRFQREAL